MTVKDLYEALERRIEQGLGDAEVFDTDGHPIISTSYDSEPINKVYIEAEF